MEGFENKDSLSKEESLRYSRQMLFPGWGEPVQNKLRASEVLVAGAGGLGSPVAIYLAAAGIGKLRIGDSDTVEATNLNRQILYNYSHLGKNKAACAEATLREFNPHIRVIPLPGKIGESTVRELVGDSQIIVDCLDNFPTRYILNKWALKKKIPYVFAAVWGLDGQITFLNPGKTPCLECIYPEAPPAETFPIIGATPGVIGCLEAMETIKYLAGLGGNLENKLLVWSGQEHTFRKVKIRQMPHCRACSGL